MILSAGEALFDMIGTTGEKGQAFLPVIGGSPLNVALGLSRLGRQVGYITRLSDDYFGNRLMDFMAAEGIDTRYVRRAPGEQTTLAFVATGADGHPVYSFYAANAADRNMLPSDLPRDLPDDVRAVHFGSISLVLEPSATSLIDYMARICATRVVAFDPNVRASLIHDRGLWLRRFEAMLGHADIVKASAEDVAWIEGGTPDVRETARRWSLQGPHVAFVTDGDQGAAVAVGGEVDYVPAFAIKMVDTVGAGDTFQASVLARLDEEGWLTKAALRGVDLASMVGIARFAGAAAAITCSRRGADLPRRREVDALLNERGGVAKSTPS